MREICRDPRAVGQPDTSEASHAEHRVAVAELAVAFYRVVDGADRIVYVTRVLWRS